MDHNPDLAQRMLADLAAVETEFPAPPTRTTRSTYRPTWPPGSNA